VAEAPTWPRACFATSALSGLRIWPTKRTGARGDRAAQAVGLIAEIGHPKALDWIEELLADADVARTAINVLDALLWRHEIDHADPRVEPLLRLAESHPHEHVRERAAFIRGYVKERE
jgi:hypothetical protein